MGKGISRLERYGKLSRTEFYSFDLQQCLSIDLFCYWTTGCGQLSGSFLGIDSLAFSVTQHRVRGSYGVIHDWAGFFEKNVFTLKKGENKSSLGFFECIGKFSFFFQFGLKWKFVLIVVCLTKTHIWKSSGSWYRGQSALVQSNHLYP